MTKPKYHLVQFVEGQKVKLLPFDNGDEFIPAETGTIIHVEDNGNMFIVEVDEPLEPQDDCIREVTLYQIEGACTCGGNLGEGPNPSNRKINSVWTCELCQTVYHPYRA